MAITNGESGLSVRTEINTSLALTQAITSTAAELNILDGATLTVTELNYVSGVTSAIQTQLDSKLASATAASTYLTIANAASTYQPLDADLTAIAALTPTNDDFLQRKAGAWANRTIAQVKTDLSLSGSNSGDQTITLTGNVTGSGTGSFATTIASGVVTVAMLSATGTPNSSTFLRGDGTWNTPAGGGGGDMLASVYDAANIAQQVVGLTATQTLTNKTLTSPIMTTPTLGVATATSINKVAITAPATGSTLTIQDGFTLTVTGNASVTGTNTGNETLSSINALAITTVGTVTSGTWSATAIDYTKGGSGLTGFTALSIAVTNTVNTRTQIAPAAGQSVRINAGGTAWEAYTPGGGGSSTLDAITAASGNATINNANTVIEWQWNSMVTTAGMTFTSSSTALTNTAFTNVADAIVGIKATGASAASNVVSKALYVSNTKTGTGSTNYGIYATTESGTGVTNAAIVAVGYQGGGLQLGAVSSTGGAIWSWAVTPSTTNYALSATASDTNINGATSSSLRAGNATRVYCTSVGVTFQAATTPIGRLNLFDSPTASANYAMFCIGSGFAGIATQFGRPTGQAAGYSATTAGTYIGINFTSAQTYDYFNCQVQGASYFRVAWDGVLSLNVSDKTAVSASALLQMDSTTRGFLPPRMTGTQAEAISSPATGLLVFSTDGSGSVITSLGWWGYSGSAWVKLN